MAQNRPSSRSRKSTEVLPKVDIDDGMRIQMVNDLIDRLDNELQQKTLFTAYSDTGNVLNLMKSDSLAKLATVISQEEGNIPSHIDQASCAALMLLLLHSREEPNVSKAQFEFIENSVELDEYDGLFSNPTVKKIMDASSKHFATCIKKNKIKQNDAQTLLTGAVLNFQCSNLESNMIKQCIIDSITQAVAMQGKTSSNGNGIKIGGSVSSGANAQYNEQFNMGNQQQFFGGKKSKLKSNKSFDTKESGEPRLAEDMQDEIVDDF